VTRPSPVNVAQSVHQRLLTRAKSERRPFNELLQHYAIERFLYRLGRSEHAEKLLLKGALLLRVWRIPMARPTMDIDVLGRTAGTQDALTAILRDCMATKVDNDGMNYDPDSLTTETITLDADYRGWRIRFRASLGNARVAMQVDVGIGDIVYPSPIWIDLSGTSRSTCPTPSGVHARKRDRGEVPGHRGARFAEQPYEGLP
jgi:hypothetical protein